jgi:hypothetical protein
MRVCGHINAPLSLTLLRACRHDEQHCAAPRWGDH